MTTTTPSRQQHRSRPGLTGTTVIAGATVLVAVIASGTIDSFASAANLRGLFLSVSLIGIIAVGLSLITIVGKVFTLAIPALVALSTIGYSSSLHLGAGTALLFTVVGAAAVGLIQGLVIGKLETDPIITTIAAAAILTGIGQLWTGGRTIVGDGRSALFNSSLLGFIPFQASVFVVTSAALYWWHKYTVQGRKLTLTGLNEKAAQISGLRSWPMVAVAFVVSGATTGLAGALLSAQSGQGTLTLGASFGFDAIVAVVVGGVGITGGLGTPIGAAVGAIFVGLLENVLALIGLHYETQLVIKGVLVLAAVTVMGITVQGRRSRK